MRRRVESRKGMTVCERRGWLLKGSDIVNGVTCRRFGLLRGDSFATYRSEADEKPSSVWPLHPKCEVTPLQEKELTVRHKGKSTLVALVAWKYEKLHGVSAVEEVWKQQQ